MDEILSAVSQGTVRRITFFSNFDGAPYGAETTPVPSVLLQIGVLGGRLSEMAPPVTDAATRPVLNLTPFFRKSLREEEGTWLANSARYALELSGFFEFAISLSGT